MAGQKNEHDTPIQQEIKDLEARAEAAAAEIGEIERAEADRLAADELRQQVEELEAEVAQRRQQRKA